MLKMILCVLFVGTLIAGEEAPKLPTSVTSIIEKAEQEVTRNRIAYDRANARVFETTERALQSELDKLTKAGKLEEALAVKKAITSIRTDVVNKVDENSKVDVLGDTRNTITQLLTSKQWNRVCVYDNASCTFKTDGTGTVDRFETRWTIEGNTVKVTFPANAKWSMTLNRKDNGFEGVLDDGSKVTLVTRK